MMLKYFRKLPLAVEGIYSPGEVAVLVLRIMQLFRTDFVEGQREEMFEPPVCKWLEVGLLLYSG